jgi:hypothetical protein
LQETFLRTLKTSTWQELEALKLAFQNKWKQAVSKLSNLLVNLMCALFIPNNLGLSCIPGMINITARPYLSVTAHVFHLQKK